MNLKTSPSVKQAAEGFLVVNATVGPFGPHEAAWHQIDQHTDHRIRSALQSAARNRIPAKRGNRCRTNFRQNNEAMQ